MKTAVQVSQMPDTIIVFCIEFSLRSAITVSNKLNFDCTSRLLFRFDGQFFFGW